MLNDFRKTMFRQLKLQQKAISGMFTKGEQSFLVGNVKKKYLYCFLYFYLSRLFESISEGISFFF